MSEPEVALIFTADAWVEELHRHLSDHGGARVRSLVVEQSVALEESYDVLVVSHRWPALTVAFVADVHARGRRVLGVHDLAEPASRAHLAAVEVDAVIEHDAGPDAFVRAIVALGSQRTPLVTVGPLQPAARAGRLIAVGGAPGTGRTEVAIELARAFASTSSTVLLDADDVAPAVAQRLSLDLEPNIRTAIDAAEHGRGDLASTVTTDTGGLHVVAGIPNPAGWAQVRPGEVIRVIDRLATDFTTVVADGVGMLDDLGGPPRARYAIAQAIARESDLIVAVCDASPVGIARMLTWTVAVRRFALLTPMVVVVNRAPTSAFRRGELYDEITSSMDVLDVVFAPWDGKVADAAWEGVPVARGRFTRSMARLAGTVRAVPNSRLDVAS